MVAVASQQLTTRTFASLSYDQQDAYLRSPSGRQNLSSGVWKQFRLQHQPHCQNPACDCYSVPDRRFKSIRWRKYCSYDCRKKPWFDQHLSARSRKTNAGQIEQLTEGIDKLIQLSIFQREQIEDLQTKISNITTIPVGSERSQIRPKLAKDDSDLSDMIEVTAAKSNANNNSGYNMIIAATLQNLGHCNALSNEMQAYGVATKRIPQHALTPENWQRAVGTPYMASASKKPEKAKPSATKGPKQIDKPLPKSSDDEDDFEDLDDLFA